MDSPDDLIVPVYLNQRIVFDFVATLQGGLAEVTKVSETTKLSTEASSELSGSFGLSKVLSSLLRIDFSGKGSVKGAGEANSTSSEDRIHTPASLLMRLRTLLRDKKWLKFDSESLQPRPGDIVEFAAMMRPNPFIKMLETFVEVLEMHQAFSGDTAPHGKKKNTLLATNDPSKMKKQMQTMLSGMKGGTTADLTTGTLNCNYRSIITLEKQYLNDSSMTDLVDGTFRVVGKVIRAINDNSDAISLNRNTAIGCLPDPVLRELQASFQTQELQSLRLPSFEWQISGPVIQVLPVAIFA